MRSRLAAANLRIELVAAGHGDVLGNGKRQIIAAAYGGYLFAWNADGSGVPGTTSQPPLTGILKSDLEAFETPPALADLDRDGLADIVVFDQNLLAIRGGMAMEAKSSLPR